MEYSSEVVRRFAAQPGAPDLAPEAPGLVTGEAEDRTLLVWVRFQLQVIDGVIQTVRYRVFGCPHTIAAASWVAERLEGRDSETLRRFDLGALQAALDVPVEKLGKLLRIEDAIAACARALEQAPVERARTN
jgi:NifU-like protein involved in Fe-S cluster formation